MADQPGAKDDAALDLSTAQVQASATASWLVGALHVTTSAVAWDYAVVLPLAGEDARPDGHSLKVTVDLDVKRGRVGVGVLNAGQNAFLAEQLLPPGQRAVTVEVSATGTRLGPLVFRNAALHGEASKFIVRRVVAARGAARWPVAVVSRNIANEALPAGGDSRVFDDDTATRLNQARLRMIEAVGLPLAGARVLDVGCGIGRFEDFYLSQGCEVVALDGRAENIAVLKQRHPSVRAFVGNIETFDLRPLGPFDVVHCLGLLYHLENPVAALRNISRVCDGVLLLETMIVDSKLPMLLLADETKAVSQALGGIGSRPSPSFVAMSLNRIGFPWVYGLAPDGEHEDFSFEWRDTNDDTRDGHPLRCFFVASRRPVSSPRLMTLVTDPSQAEEHDGAGAEAFDSSPVEAADGERLAPPHDLELKPVPDWSRYYGEQRLTLDERRRSAHYAALDRIKVMAWLEDLDVLIRPNDQLSRALYLSGTYEPASLLAMKRLLRPGGIFLDVGANVGIYSMLASRWVGPSGHVFSFEPSEREYLHLLRHIERNRLANVTALRTVVADHDGVFPLRVADSPYAGLNTTGGRFVYEGVTASHTEEVEGVTLDGFAARGRLERIDLVKADVEGAECAVLAGAGRVLHEWRPSWIVEVAPDAVRGAGHGPPAIFGVFHDARYRLFRIDEFSAAFMELRHGDGISAGNVVAAPIERELT